MAEAESQITEKIYDPGNVLVHSCSLIHANGITNLSGGLYEFYVTYSLTSHSASCKVIVLDTQDILANIDIDGSEKIVLSWSSHNDDVITNEFAVYEKHTQVDKSQGAKGKVYEIHGFDNTNLKQMTMDINKTFKGRISDFAKFIFNQINSDKEIDVHQTTGTSTLLIPGETPFEAMNRLLTFAFSSVYTSSLFKFYQSAKGYNFKNIERLIAENRSSPHMYRYTPTAELEQSKSKMAKHTIVDISFPEKRSLIDKIVRGTYASRVAEIDIINQKIDITDFSAKDEFANFYHLDNPAISSDKLKVIDESLNIINKTTWLNKYFDGERHLDFKRGPAITKSKFYGGSLDQNVMSCTVHGNSSLDVGEVLYLSMLETSGRTDTPEQEKIITGNYLISEVTHIYKNKTYACNLLCNKESGRANVNEIENYIVGERE